MSIFSKLFKRPDRRGVNPDRTNTKSLTLESSKELELQLEKLSVRNQQACEALKLFAGTELNERLVIDHNTEILANVKAIFDLINSSDSRSYSLFKFIQGLDLEESEYEVIESTEIKLEGLQNWQREVERNLTALGKKIKHLNQNNQADNFTNNINRDKTIVDLDRDALIREISK